MDDTNLSSAMLARIGRHVAVTILGFVGGIGLMVLGAVVGHAVFGDATPSWFRAATLAIGVLFIPVVGIGAAFRMLRCPGCNGHVAMQVSGQAAVFGNPSCQCRHCGKTIFDDRYRRRVRIMQVVVFFTTLIVFGSAAIFSNH